MNRRHERFSKSKETIRGIIAAGGVVYREKDGKEGHPEYLLLRHKRGRYWGLPKGRKERGETDLQTARREIEEETGITPKDIGQRLNQVVRYFVKRGKRLIPKEIRLFLVKVTYGDVKLSNEHIAFKWLRIEDALTQVSHANMRDVLLEAHSRITSKDEQK